MAQKAANAQFKSACRFVAALAAAPVGFVRWVGYPAAASGLRLLVRGLSPVRRDFSPGGGAGKTMCGDIQDRPPHGAAACAVQSF